MCLYLSVLWAAHVCKAHEVKNGHQILGGQELDTIVISGFWELNLSFCKSSACH